MIIGVDYRLAVSSNRGMGRYCREIIIQLVNIDIYNQYVFYVDMTIADIFPVNVTIKQIPTRNYVLGEQLYLPFFAKKDNLDVLWSPSNTFPLFLDKKIKLVVTIHDLIFWKHSLGNSNIKQKLGRVYRKYCLFFGKRRINKCLTVSEFSQKEIISKLGIKEVLITPNCIDSFAKKISQSSNDLYTKLKTEKPFYFTLSGDAPSKNLPFLIDHFNKFLSNELLLIAGVPRKSKIRRLETDNIIFLTDNLTDEQLIAYYKKCKVFLFLSLQEGFGIPLLESLVCGAKIIASNCTSIPEIVGEFGILINPESHEELNTAIKKIDNFFIDKKKLNLHLNEFISWRKPAQIVLNIFKLYEK